MGFNSGFKGLKGLFWSTGGVSKYCNDPSYYKIQGIFACSAIVLDEIRIMTDLSSVSFVTAYTDTAVPAPRVDVVSQPTACWLLKKTAFPF